MNRVKIKTIWEMQNIEIGTTTAEEMAIGAVQRTFVFGKMFSLKMRQNAVDFHPYS